MKIAVSAEGRTLDDKVDPRFGRCRYFVVVDPDTLDFEPVDNSASASGGGAGVSSAQVIAGAGVSAVMTGNCGPNAHEALSAAGVQVVTGVTGTVRDAVGRYMRGEYFASDRPSVPEHFGSGGGRG